MSDEELEFVDDALPPTRDGSTQIMRFRGEGREGRVPEDGPSDSDMPGTFKGPHPAPELLVADDSPSELELDRPEPPPDDGPEPDLEAPDEALAQDLPQVMVVEPKWWQKRLSIMMFVILALFLGAIFSRALQPSKAVELQPRLVELETATEPELPLVAPPPVRTETREVTIPSGETWDLSVTAAKKVATFKVTCDAPVVPITRKKKPPPCSSKVRGKETIVDCCARVVVKLKISDTLPVLTACETSPETWRFKGKKR